MSIQLHHVSITCRNLEQCCRFYEKIGFDKYRSYQDDGVTILLMRGNHTYIELFNFSKEDQKDITINNSQTLPELKKTGISHFALQVSDLKKTREKLSPNYQCSEIQKARLGLFSYFFALDPECNQVEFIQRNNI